MKIELDDISDSRNKINSYDPGHVTIANKIYTSSLLVSPETIIPDWPPKLSSDLTRLYIEQLTALQPEIVILGTGKNLIFPPASIMSPLTEKNIGFEVMDTGAACRSYNFLVGEGRNVIAALLMIETKSRSQ